jgi:hypothetical protein
MLMVNSGGDPLLPIPVCVFLDAFGLRPVLEQALLIGEIFDEVEGLRMTECMTVRYVYCTCLIVIY